MMIEVFIVERNGIFSLLQCQGRWSAQEAIAIQAVTCVEAKTPR